MWRLLATAPSPAFVDTLVSTSLFFILHGAMALLGTWQSCNVTLKSK